MFMFLHVKVTFCALVAPPMGQSGNAFGHLLSTRPSTTHTHRSKIFMFLHVKVTFCALVAPPVGKSGNAFGHLLSTRPSTCD